MPFRNALKILDSRCLSKIVSIAHSRYAFSQPSKIVTMSLMARLFQSLIRDMPFRNDDGVGRIGHINVSFNRSFAICLFATPAEKAFEAEWLRFQSLIRDMP